MSRVRLSIVPPDPPRSAHEDPSGDRALSPRLRAVQRALSVDEAAADPVWLAVARQRLHQGALDGVDDPDERHLSALFAPLPATALDRVARRVDPRVRTDAQLAGLARALSLADLADEPVWSACARGQVTPTGASADERRLATLFAPVDPRSIARRVGRGRRARARRHAVWGRLVALAAALSLWALWPVTEAPGYTIALSAGDRAMRGGSTHPRSTPAFRPDSLVEVIARPDRAVEGSVAARAWLIDGAGHARPVAMPFEVQVTGAVTYHGPAAPLFVAAPGLYTLRLALGAAGGQQTLEHPIRLLPRGPP